MIRGFEGCVGSTGRETQGTLFGFWVNGEFNLDLWVSAADRQSLAALLAWSCVTLELEIGSEKIPLSLFCLIGILSKIFCSNFLQHIREIA